MISWFKVDWEKRQSAYHPS